MATGAAVSDSGSELFEELPVIAEEDRVRQLRTGHLGEGSRVEDQEVRDATHRIEDDRQDDTVVLVTGRPDA